MKPKLGENPNHLPSELMHEILSWLPVKSLRRFECVSKPWHSLIADPKFSTMHFNKAIKDKDRLLCQRRSVIVTDVAHNGLYSMHLDEFLDHNDTDHDQNLVSAIEHEYVCSEVSGIFVSLLCSCNDLLCMLCDSRLYLVDPSTKETKKLPEIPKEENYRNSVKVYGVGFDRSTFEHKVVTGIYNKHDYLTNPFIDDFDEGVVFSVYTLETDSWRKIERLFPYITSQQGIMLNGDLHWFGERLENLSQVIVSLALTGEERVREIPLPFECDSLKSIMRKMKLGVFRHCLCITHHSYPRGGTYNEFWVMTEYGVRESWTKMRVSIPYSMLKHSGFWTESHDLMVFGEQLIMYNLNDQSHRKINIRGISKVGRVFTCLESLVSLKQRQKSNLNIEA